VKIISKEPYWLLKNGIINPDPSLQENIRCDILIIGGGITGALVAYQLSSEGYKTVVIDKRNVGTGSTIATTSMVQFELDIPLYLLSEQTGIEGALDIYTGAAKAVKKLEHIINSLAIECEFSTKDSLHFANSKPDAENLIKELGCQKMAGLPVKWLPKDQVFLKYGLVSEGGMLTKIAASMDAYQMTDGLLQYCTKHFGLRVYEETQLQSVEYRERKNLAKVDTHAVIECNALVYTTGYESHELIRKGIGKLISTYACISEPFENIPDTLLQTVFWNTESPYFYFRTTSDNRILIGGEDENFKNPERRDLLIEEKEVALVNKINKLMPGTSFVPDFTWAGTFGATKDSLPYIGSHPDFPNSYFMLGFGGNGITFSVMGMEILSDAIGGKSNKFLEYFKFKR
jgi:glycine/D-amino acid oxidase-like deaminating enzyme